MNKKGLGHIEIILAFILFTGFLIFGLYFFNPLDSQRVLSSSSFYVIDEIKQNVSREMEEYSIVFSQSVNVPSVSFALARGSDVGNGVRVETETGETLPHYYDGSILSVGRDNARFVKVYFGDFSSVQSTIPSPLALNEGDYTVSSSTREEYFTEQNLLALNDSYYRSYDALKTSFNIPRRVEFTARFVFPDKVIEMSHAIPEGVEVYSHEERVKVIREDGSIVFVDFNSQVW